jgi:peptidoglycan/xylan/chitin deacetylase (PgdA/CDA1 family)
MEATLSFRTAPIIWVFHGVHDVAWFERCIDEISAVQEVLPLVELAHNPRRRKACAITFDDGLRSVLDTADPVLGARGHPYTVFVCTDVLAGGPVPWFLRVAYLIERLGLDPVKQRWKLTDPAFSGMQQVITGLKQVSLDSILQGLDELEDQYALTPPVPTDLFLSGEEVKSLAATGTTIGSHTHRHPILSLMSAEEQKFEIRESMEVIESVTGRRPIEFAYPNGTPLDFDATTISILRASGIELALTTTQRHLSARDDPLAMPRIGLSDGDSHIRRVFRTIAPSLSMSHMRERRLRSRVGV